MNDRASRMLIRQERNECMFIVTQKERRIVQQNRTWQPSGGLKKLSHDKMVSDQMAILDVLKHVQSAIEACMHDGGIVLQAKLPVLARGEVRLS